MRERREEKIGHHPVPRCLIFESQNKCHGRDKIALSLFPITSPFPSQSPPFSITSPILPNHLPFQTTSLPNHLTNLSQSPLLPFPIISLPNHLPFPIISPSQTTIIVLILSLQSSVTTATFTTNGTVYKRVQRV